MTKSIVKSKQIGFLRGIHSISRVMMEQSALARFQALVMENARNHRSAEEILSDDDFKAPFLHELRCYAKNGAQTRQLYIDESYDLLEANEEGLLVQATVPSSSAAGSQSATVPSDSSEGNQQPEEEQKVLFLHCEGPVTRGGGMCSYGSIDYRNLLQEYAEDPSVAGMVFLTDTPGGDAMAMYDFEDGMRAWKASGKRSIQLVDGNCFSAGEAMGCQCDYQIAVNPHNGFGCIGAMVSGFITPANSENTITHERFLHVVAEQTPDKNAMWEKAANGDTAEVQAWVSESAKDFIDMMHQCRPNVKDEHLTGKTYEAGDVFVSLCDGIGTIDDAIHYCLTGEVTWQSGTVPSDPSEGNTPDILDPENPDSPSTPDSPSPVPSESSEGSTPQKTIYSQKDMTILQKIAAVLGIKDDATEPTAQSQEPAAPATEPAVPTEPAAPSAPAEPSDPTTVPSGSPEGPIEPDPAQEGGEQSPAEPAAPTEPSEPAEPSAPAEPAEPATVPSGSPEGPTEPAPSAELAALQQQLADEQAAAAALQASFNERLSSITAERDTLTAERDAHAATIASLTAERDTLTAERDAHAATIASLTAERDSFRSLLTECHSTIASLEASVKELTEQNDLLKAVGAAPKTPAPAPAATPAAVDTTPDEFQPGMTADEIRAVQKKKNARRAPKA